MAEDRSFITNLKKTLHAPPFVYFTGWEVLMESCRDLLGIRPAHSDDNATHLAALADWLRRAQDATPDRGVARSYSLVYKPFFRKKGWFGSYPETTGYIIPTLFDYHYLSGQQDFRKRALDMAEWEASIQMPEGAVMGGTVDFRPSPAVFNTGQVIFGWLRAYRETGDQAHLKAAIRAGDFLVQNQDPKGFWSKGSSKFAAAGSTVYNTRVAWALALLAEVSGDSRYAEAATRKVDWALERQRDNGWFADNCLSDAERPLVHTIAYAIQGVLETGIALSNERFVERAAVAAEALVGLQHKDGRLAGRYDQHWQPAVSWSCLTGNAQMSIIWSRMHQLGIRTGMDRAAGTANRFLRSTINLRTSSPGRRGGVKGAYPVYGAYGEFEYLNWAVKFTMDALLMEERSAGNPSLRNAPETLFWAS